MTNLNPQALEAATKELLYASRKGALSLFNASDYAAGAIQAYLSALPVVDEGVFICRCHPDDKFLAPKESPSCPKCNDFLQEYLCEKLRGAAADCNIRLEIDQQRYILKAIPPIIRPTPIEHTQNMHSVEHIDKDALIKELVGGFESVFSSSR